MLKIESNGRDSKKRIYSGELILLTALLNNSFCVALLAESKFGLTTLSSVPYAFFKAFPYISFGNWNSIVLIAILFILYLLDRKTIIYYLLSITMSFLFGFFIDFFLYILKYIPNYLPLRIIKFAVGFLLLPFGVVLFNICDYPVLPYDCFVRDISKKYNIELSRFKLYSDLVCVFLATIVSLSFTGQIAGVGVGTVISALFTGPMVKVWSKKLDGIKSRSLIKV